MRVHALGVMAFFLAASPAVAHDRDSGHDGFQALVSSRVPEADLSGDGTYKVTRKIDSEGRLSEITYRDTSVQPPSVEHLVITRNTGDGRGEEWVRTVHRGSALVRREKEIYSRPGLLEEQEVVSSSKGRGPLDRRVVSRFEGITVHIQEYVGREGAWKLVSERDETGLTSKGDPDPTGLYVSCLENGKRDGECARFLDAIPFKGGAPKQVDFTSLTQLECKNEKEEALYLPNGYRVDMRSCLPESKAYALRDATNQVSGKLMACLFRTNRVLAQKCAGTILERRPRLQCSKGDSLYSAYDKAYEKYRDDREKPAADLPACKKYNEDQDKYWAQDKLTTQAGQEFYGPEYWDYRVGKKLPVYGSDEDPLRSSNALGCKGTLREIWCDEQRVPMIEDSLKKTQAELAALTPAEAGRQWDMGRTKGQYLRETIEFQKQAIAKAKAYHQELIRNAEKKKAELTKIEAQRDKMFKELDHMPCELEKRAGEKAMADEIRKTQPDVGLTDHVCEKTSTKSPGAGALSPRERCEVQTDEITRDSGGFYTPNTRQEIYLMPSGSEGRTDDVAATIFHETLHACGATAGPQHNDRPTNYGDAVYGCEALCAGTAKLTREGCIACVTDGGNPGNTKQCLGYPSARALHTYSATKDTRENILKCMHRDTDACSKLTRMVSRCKAESIKSETCEFVGAKAFSAECMSNPSDQCIGQTQIALAGRLLELKKQGDLDPDKVEGLDAKMADNALWDGLCAELQAKPAAATAKALLKKYEFDDDTDWQAKCEPLKTQWFSGDKDLKRPVDR